MVLKRLNSQNPPTLDPTFSHNVFVICPSNSTRPVLIRFSGKHLWSRSLDNPDDDITTGYHIRLHKTPQQPQKTPYTWFHRLSDTVWRISHLDCTHFTHQWTCVPLITADISPQFVRSGEVYQCGRCWPEPAGGGGWLRWPGGCHGSPAGYEGKTEHHRCHVWAPATNHRSAEGVWAGAARCGL